MKVLSTPADNELGCWLILLLMPHGSELKQTVKLLPNCFMFVLICLILLHKLCCIGFMLSIVDSVLMFGFIVVFYIVQSSQLAAKVKINDLLI